jgi:DNA-binding MarR family transcriptional regulator
MNSIDRRAAGLQDLVQEILKQFQTVNTAAANGPHVDLKIQEMRTIEFLGTGGARMMREVAEHLSVAVNSLTSIVDGLEQKGLVLRQRSEEDRRVIRVELTAEGEHVYRSSVEANLRLFRSMLQSLTEDEQEIFMVLFRKISRAGRTQLQAFAA